MSYPVALMPLPNDEIGPLLRDLGAAANETGRVFVFCLRLPHGATQWLILTVPVVASDAGEGKEAGYSLPRTEEPFLAKHPAARPSPTDEEFAALKKHLESALSYLSTIIALQHNPLTRALDYPFINIQATTRSSLMARLCGGQSAQPSKVSSGAARRMLWQAVTLKLVLSIAAASERHVNGPG